MSTSFGDVSNVKTQPVAESNKKSIFVQKKRELDQRYQQLFDEREGLREMLKNSGQLTEADQNELKKLAKDLADKTKQLKKEANELKEYIRIQNTKEEFEKLMEKTEALANSTQTMSKFQTLPKVRRK
jgi:Rad3-related DNA helicase